MKCRKCGHKVVVLPNNEYTDKFSDDFFAQCLNSECIHHDPIGLFQENPYFSVCDTAIVSDACETDGNTIALRVRTNLPLHGVESGGTIVLQADKDGLPIDIAWRARVNDSRFDGCVEILLYDPHTN